MVVGDVKPRRVPFIFHVFKYLVEGLDDCGVGEVFDRDCVDIVGVIIVRHVVALVAVDESEWECAGCIRVQGALVLVRKHRKAKYVAYCLFGVKK